MSWAPIEHWPGDEGGDSPYREAAEPVLASFDLERDRPGKSRKSFRIHDKADRATPWMKRGALTETYLYVEGSEGKRYRAELGALKGLRFTGKTPSEGVAIIGHQDGTRWACPAPYATALLAALRERLPHAQARFTSRAEILGAFFLSLALLLTLFGAWLVLSATVFDKLSNGLAWEAVAMTCACVFLLALLQLGQFWFVSHIVVDPLGVRWAPYIDKYAPRTRSVVAYSPRFNPPKTAAQVELRFDEPVWTGGLWRSDRLALSRVYREGQSPTVHDTIESLRQIYDPPSQSTASTAPKPRHGWEYGPLRLLLLLGSLFGSFGYLLMSGEPPREEWERDVLSDTGRCELGYAEGCYYAGYALTEPNLVLISTPPGDTDPAELLARGCAIEDQPRFAALSCMRLASIQPTDATESHANYVRACQLGNQVACYEAGPPWDGTGATPPPQWPRVPDAPDAPAPEPPDAPSPEPPSR